MSYPSYLSTAQSDLIKHHFDTGNYGKSRKYEQKILVNAVFYITKTGCQWHFLPKNFPPYSR
jgi:transposase